MLIHGGIDDNGKVINDCRIIDYRDLRWQKLHSAHINSKNLNTINTNSSPYFAFHACAMAISEKKLESQGFNIYEYCNYRLPGNKTVILMIKQIYI